MVHRFASLTSLLLASSLLLACASPSERRLEVRDDESFAMHILRAADIRGLRDAPPDAAMSFQGLQTGVVGPSDIGRIGHVALSAANPVGGVSALGAGLGAGLLSFAIIPGETEAERSSIMAWAPDNFARSSEEAEIKFLEMLKIAFSNAINDTSFESYKFVENNIEDAFSDSSERTRSFQFVKHDGECKNMRWGRCRLIVTVGLRSHAQLDAAPNIIGDRTAWEFTRNRGLVPLWALAEDGEFPHDYRAVGDDLLVYTRVSEQLPEWVFIYIAPNRVGFRDQDGALKLYPLPVILNQGRAHYFVRGARDDSVVRTGF